MPPFFTFNSSAGGGLPPFPPPDPTQTRALVEDPLNPGVAVWQCLSSADLCTLPPGFSVTLTPLIPGPFEIGSQVLNPQFNAVYHNSIEILATLQDDKGNPVQNVLGVANPLTMPFAYQLNPIGSTTVYTLSGDNGGGLQTDQITFTWLPRVYWGVGLDGLSTEADIEGLGNSALAATFGRVFTVTAGPANHIYYAFPSVFGTPSFQIGPFPGGFVLEAAAVPVTAGTPGAPTNNYDLWKSTLPNLGTETTTVS